MASSPTITVDGSLSEAVWAQAESVLVTYGAKTEIREAVTRL